MGDGGLSVGSAWLAHHEITKKYPHKPKTMYLGYKISKQNFYPSEDFWFKT